MRVRAVGQCDATRTTRRITRAPHFRRAEILKKPHGNRFRPYAGAVSGDGISPSVHTLPRRCFVGGNHHLAVRGGLSILQGESERVSIYVAGVSMGGKRGCVGGSCVFLWWRVTYFASCDFACIARVVLLALPTFRSVLPHGLTCVYS